MYFRSLGFVVFVCCCMRELWYCDKTGKMLYNNLRNWHFDCQVKILDSLIHLFTYRVNSLWYIFSLCTIGAWLWFIYLVGDRIFLKVFPLPAPPPNFISSSTPMRLFTRTDLSWYASQNFSIAKEKLQYHEYIILSRISLLWKSHMSKLFEKSTWQSKSHHI